MQILQYDVTNFVKLAYVVHGVQRMSSEEEFELSVGFGVW